MLQPVWVALYVHAMALSKRTEWVIFRKEKGEIILCQVLDRMNGESANQFIDMPIWTLSSSTPWSGLKMNSWCSCITLHVNGPKTSPSTWTNFLIQCGCRTSSFIYSGLPFPNFTSQHMGLIAKVTFHSTTNLIWHVQMVKTQSAGGLTLIQ